MSIRMLNFSSEVKCDSGRESEVVLRIAEESGLKEIGLDSPGDHRNEFVVEAATDRVSKRSVGGRRRERRRSDIYVRDPSEDVSEWSELANRHRDLRSEKDVEHVFAGVRGWTRLRASQAHV